MRFFATRNIHLGKVGFKQNEELVGLSQAEIDRLIVEGLARAGEDGTPIDGSGAPVPPVETMTNEEAQQLVDSGEAEIPAEAVAHEESPAEEVLGQEDGSDNVELVEKRRKKKR